MDPDRYNNMRPGRNEMAKTSPRKGMKYSAGRNEMAKTPD
jgi:hypothetical protein